MVIHVIGAGSGIGRWFVKNVFSKKCESVFAYDIEPKVTNEYDDFDNVSAVYLDRNKHKGDYLWDIAPNITSRDWVFLAVPEQELDSLCPHLSTHLPAGCLLVTMTSRQVEALSFIQKSVKNVTVCGMHPLFGPTLTTPHGQIAALCCENSELKQIKELKDYLQDCGLSIPTINSRQHDSSMGYVQSLTHFVLLSFFETISMSDHELKNLMELKTPPFQFLFAFASRILNGSPSTYATIQELECAEQVRKHFLTIARNIDADISKNTHDKNVDRISQMREPFSGTELDEYSQFSVIAVEASQAKERNPFEVKNGTELAVFKTKGSLRIRAGYVKSISSTDVKIDEFRTLVSFSDGNKYFPFPVNNECIVQYTRDGVSKNKMLHPLTVKKGNISFLEKYEAREWLLQNALPVSRNFVVTNPRKFNNEMFETWIPRMVNLILSCEVAMEDNKKSTHSQLLLTVKFIPWISEKKLERFLRMFSYGHSLNEASIYEHQN